VSFPWLAVKKCVADIGRNIIKRKKHRGSKSIILIDLTFFPLETVLTLRAILAVTKVFFTHSRQNNIRKFLMPTSGITCNCCFFVQR
jgi:hypothetical protein